MSQFEPNSEAAQLPRNRIIALAIAATLMLGILIWRMYFLQVIEHEKHLAVANQNRIDVRPLKPKRGLIFDRNDILVADNQPSFNLNLVPEKVESQDQIKTLLPQYIKLTEDQIKIIDKMKSIPRRPFEPLNIKDRLTSKEIASIVVNQHKLPGIQVEAELRRFYPYSNVMAHILGFVGHLTESEKRALSSDKQGITHVGKKGLELSYESMLSGKSGHEFIETNARGRMIRTLQTEHATAGNDLKLTIDVQLQNAMFNILSEHKRAAAVAINPQNGEILAMSSVPSYDPNSFVYGISQKEYNQLLHNKLRPLFNRAVQGQYPPGSTIKPMIGLAALNLGTTTWDYKIWDPGYFQIENQPQRYRDWKRWGHGKVDLERAIIESCDTYFYDVSHKTNIDALASQMTNFNFGHPTGIDLNGESKGLFPTSQWKKARFEKPWYPGETLIASIGQGYVLATPLQLAQATAILANYGKSTTPHLVSQFKEHKEGSDWIKIEYPSQSLFDMDAPGVKANWSKMINAMQKVVTSTHGTAKKINNDLHYTIAGKTGTSQVVAIAQNKRYDADALLEEHRDHALFVGFAPVENPTIALAVIVENGGGGGSVAAPVARQIFDAYMSLSNKVNN